MATEIEPAPEAGTDEARPAVAEPQVAAPPAAAAPAFDGPPSPARRRRWPRLGIQSKLLLMLLATSITSCVVVGVVGYRSGRDALRERAFEQLTFLRNSRTRELVRESTLTANQLVVFTRGRTAIEAIDAFEAGFHELADSTLAPAKAAELDAFYAEEFIPDLDANLGTTSLPDVFVPTSPAQRWVQAWYTAPAAGDFDAALAVDDAGDGSAWSAAHAQYHPFFRQLVERFGYEDALLIDEDGEVLYSAYKGVDLGTNVLDGPYDRSALTQAYEDALESNATDFVARTDLERYQPSYGVPAGWIVSPIGEADEIHGVLALQLSIASINEVMTGNGEWRRDGLGDTGETYLVGPDDLMRSTSRLVTEDPEEFERASIRGGTPPDVAARAARVGGTILIQPVDTEQVARAQRGETGELIGRDYLGNEVLAAYTPIEVDGVNWVVVAELDTSEAFAPVDDFTRRLVITTAGIIVAVALASLLLAQIFSRPIRRLLVGVRQVAAGDLGAQVASSSTDEFADLAAAFNDMSRSLETKQDLLDTEKAEHQRLLLSMMPEAVAQRYRQGEETISQEHQDVAVVYADIAGFDEYASELDAATSLAQLNELVRQFDEAAQRLGVERVRTLRNGYLASVGLVQPRVDNTVRALDFAREVLQIVDRFNTTRGTSLALRAGLDAGKVTSGLVGRSSVVYDMWGDAVNLAFRVQGTAAIAGIYVTQQVYDRLRDTVRFEQVAPIETSTGEQPVWRVAS